MVNRQQVAQLAQDRRELGLILETVIEKNFPKAFNVRKAIEDPVGYCEQFFMAKGIQLLSRFGEAAFEIGKTFQEKIKE